MKKYILLLLGIILGFLGGLFANLEVLEDSLEIRKRNISLELAVNVARDRIYNSEKAAGQLSDVIRCYRDHHIGEPDSIYEFIGDFADSTVIEQYLSEYCYSY